MNYQGRLYMGLHDCSRDRIDRPPWRDGSQGSLKPEVVHVTIGNPAFLPHLIFNWYIFGTNYSTLVTWVRKSQELTNQNSKNKWCQIARGTKWTPRICHKWKHCTLLKSQLIVASITWLNWIETNRNNLVLFW